MMAKGSQLLEDPGWKIAVKSNPLKMILHMDTFLIKGKRCILDFDLTKKNNLLIKTYKPNESELSYLSIIYR